MSLAIVYGYCPWPFLLANECWVWAIGYKRFWHHKVFSFGLHAMCAGYVPVDEVSGGLARLNAPVFSHEAQHEAVWINPDLAAFVKGNTWRYESDYCGHDSGLVLL